MKSDAVYKRTLNSLLDRLTQLAPEATLESEKRMTEIFDVSRSTVHKVLSGLTEKGVISTRGAGPR